MTVVASARLTSRQVRGSPSARRDTHDLTRAMRQKRTFPCLLSMHNYASSRAIGAGTAALIVGPELRSRA
jgi:hypothetical protein